MVNKICKYCKKQFQVNNYRKNSATYCSNKCRRIDKQVVLLKMECEKCEEIFTREQWKQESSHKGSFCSIECYKQRAPDIKVECICGKRFKARRSRVSYYHRLFCSRACYSRNGFFGRLTDDIPESGNYGRFVARLRSTASYQLWTKGCLKKDNFTCTQCEANKNLTVHHKTSIYDFVKKHGLNKGKIEKDKLFFDINNGETVCRRCHLDRHRKKDEQNYKDQRSP